jgi:hypothetical protein
VSLFFECSPRRLLAGLALMVASAGVSAGGSSAANDTDQWIFPGTTETEVYTTKADVTRAHSIDARRIERVVGRREARRFLDVKVCLFRDTWCTEKARAVVFGRDQLLERWQLGRDLARPFEALNDPACEQVEAVTESRFSGRLVAAGIAEEFLVDSKDDEFVEEEGQSFSGRLFAYWKWKRERLPRQVAFPDESPPAFEDLNRAARFINFERIGRNCGVDDQAQRVAGAAHRALIARANVDPLDRLEDTQVR